MMEKGESVPMNFESTSREGLFDDEQLYAVYEKEDVKNLLHDYKKLLNKYGKTNR